MHIDSKMPVLPQDADPLGFWRDNSASSLLRPPLPLAASVSAVPAAEAICERLFKAGGQVLTSARLRLLGSRVEAVLMTNFNLQLANAARQRPDASRWRASVESKRASGVSL